MSGDLSGGVPEDGERGELRFVLRDLGRTGGEVRRPHEVRARHRRAVGAGLVTVAVLGAAAVGSQPAPHSPPPPPPTRTATPHAPPVTPRPPHPAPHRAPSPSAP
ncbi:hypothetical protein AB0A69_29825 [Streptomyces sp. NPDC045431]|uniref:hypothetical protein n=1 Tax=Streptomyces sp. NPDC045431 TaxID=3155613 RepID=UPI0033D180D5